MNQPRFAPPLTAALLACVALTACNKPADDGRARVDRPAVSQAERKADDIQSSAEKGLQRSKDAATDVAKDAKVAANEVGDKVSDAVITSSVNAELAKDAKLSALKINVDTSGGRVALRGKAPDAASKARATVLAQGVKGVVSVDNQLTVDPKG